MMVDEGQAPPMSRATRMPEPDALVEHRVRPTAEEPTLERTPATGLRDLAAANRWRPTLTQETR